MSKFTDFYPAASGVGFPFTGSAGMTGSLNTEVLGVEGGVAFSYNNVGTTRGWSTNSYSLPLSVGQRNASIGGINNSVIIGGTSNPTSTQLFDGIAATSTTAFPYVARDKRGAGTATDAVFAGGSAYQPNSGPSKNNTNTCASGATVVRNSYCTTRRTVYAVYVQYFSREPCLCWFSWSFEYCGITPLAMGRIRWGANNTNL